MKKIWTGIVGILMLLILTGCGSNELSESKMSEYEKGIKLVDLSDEKTYAENGKKMAAAVEAVLNAGTNDFHMMKQKSHFLKGGVSFQEIYDESKCDYYYVGDLKDGKPEGFGVLLSGNPDYGSIMTYIGKFSKGEVKDSYGVCLAHNDICLEIAYEGKVKYLRNGSDACPADGKREIPWDFLSIQIAYGDTEYYENINFSPTIVAKCFPHYIGEIKKGSYSGKGCLYYANGVLGYEGEFKGGNYNGKGKEYSPLGNLIKDGEYKRGEFVDGFYDKEQEQIDEAILESGY